MYARIPAPEGLYEDNGETIDEDSHDKEENSETSPCRSTNAESSSKSEGNIHGNVDLIEDRKDKPKNVSQHLWEKFKVLQKRTDEATKRSTEKRIKHLQKQTLTKVQEEITNSDDLDVLRDHDVRLGPPNIRKQDNQTPGKKRKQDTQSSDASSSSSNPEWQEVKSLLTVNDHLKGVDRGKHAPKTQLEKKVDKAVAAGDVERAEELSDQLSTREFGKKIADAIDARNYLREKKEEEESVKTKKKKKLNWGFEHKQRWETKGNM